MNDQLYRSGLITASQTSAFPSVAWEQGESITFEPRTSERLTYYSITYLDNELLIVKVNQVSLRTSKLPPCLLRLNSGNRNNIFQGQKLIKMVYFPDGQIEDKVDFTEQ